MLYLLYLRKISMEILREITTCALPYMDHVRGMIFFYGESSRLNIGIRVFERTQTIPLLAVMIDSFSPSVYAAI